EENDRRQSAEGGPRAAARPVDPAADQGGAGAAREIRPPRELGVPRRRDRHAYGRAPVAPPKKLVSGTNVPKKGVRHQFFGKGCLTRIFGKMVSDTNFATL